MIKWINILIEIEKPNSDILDGLISKIEHKIKKSAEISSIKDMLYSFGSKHPFFYLSYNFKYLGFDFYQSLKSLKEYQVDNPDEIWVTWDEFMNEDLNVFIEGNNMGLL